MMLSKFFKGTPRLLVAVALLIAFGTGVFIGTPALTPSAQAETAYQTGGEDIAAVYEEVSQSVVNINVVQRIEGEEFFEFQGPDDFDMPFEVPDEILRGQGSGLVYDNLGHIITNYHVVEDAEKIDVTFRDGTMARAEVVGVDPESDIAVIRVDVDPGVLRPVTFADTDALYVGQPVLAIGSPFGQDWTLTTGIISALGRTIDSGFTVFSIPSVIQTDAAINPGNSGGPLLDIEGNVVGVNAQILSRSQSSSGVGFAIPGNLVQRVAQTLIDEGAFTYPWLGISGQSLTLDLIEAMDLSADQRGALVVEVANGGPADKAGVHGSDATAEVDGVEYRVGGDIIIAINAKPITHMDQLITYLVEETRPGDEVTLTVVRDGAEETITVTLGERSEYQSTSQQ